MSGFIPGTKISLEDGSVKNIEDIIIGDCVLNHNGTTSKVENISKTNYSGNLLKISISNNIPLICTKNTEFFIARNLTNDSSLPRTIKNNKCDLLFSNIKIKDLLLQPIINKLLKSNLNENKSRLLGLFAAEGSFKKTNNKYYSAVFSFSYKEKDTLAKECINLINREYSKLPHCNLSQNKTTITCSDKDLIKDCLYHIGEYSLYKTLSKEIMYSSYQNKISFITGWLEGDGCIDKYSGKIIGTTISNNLAYQIRIMLNSLNINNTLYLNHPAVSEKVVGKHKIYRLKISYNYAKDIFVSNKFNFNLKCKDRRINSFIDNYRFYKILHLEDYSYNDVIYSLNTTNNSFIANCVSVR